METQSVIFQDEYESWGTNLGQSDPEQVPCPPES